MNPVITWKYRNFGTYDTYGQYTNVVHEYEYECNVVIAEYNIVYSKFGKMIVNLARPECILSYNELTQEKVQELTERTIPTQMIAAQAVDEALRNSSLNRQNQPAPWETPAAPTT
jgi:predicted nucleotide-binding protein (sugar kinase/HSP70/actin superfamily)